MPSFTFSEVLYLITTPPALFGDFLFRLDFYGGFDVRGRPAISGNPARAGLTGANRRRCRSIVGAISGCPARDSPT